MTWHLSMLMGKQRVGSWHGLLGVGSWYGLLGVMCFEHSLSQLWGLELVSSGDWSYGRDSCWVLLF